MGLQVGTIRGRFQHGAPSWKDLRNISTWNSKSERSAEHWKNLRKISTWGAKLEKSAEDFNMEPQVGEICGRFQHGAPSVIFHEH